MPVAGLTIIPPSSVTTTTGSASIRTNGGVNFTSATIVRVEDVFSSDYRFYRLLIRTKTTTSQEFVLSLRSGGTTNTSSYFNQREYASGSTTSTNYASRNGFFLAQGESYFQMAMEVDLFDVATSGYSACIVRNVTDSGYAATYNSGGIHVVSQAFTGFELNFYGNQTGNVMVYGLGQ